MMIKKRLPVTGLAVDPSGGPVVDPTANVIALNEASATRQDDLRRAHEKYTDMRFRYVERIARIYSEHMAEMGDKESQRIDSIRRVDIQNAATQATQSLTAIQTLASTTISNAEAIRAQVAATAATMATQQAAMVTRIEERIAALERSSYEGAGKQRVFDPQMNEFMSDMKGAVASLVKAQASSQGSHSGVSSTWVWISVAVAAFGSMTGVAAVAVTLVMYLTKH